MSRLRLIQRYYLLSPLFFVFGWWWHAEIRVTFLPDPGIRFGYYLILSGLGLLIHFKARLAPWVALAESLVNLLLLMLWILLPIYSAADGALEIEPGGEFALPYTAGQVLLNGLMAGSVFLLGFYQAQGEILSRFRGNNRRRSGDLRRPTSRT